MSIDSLLVAAPAAAAAAITTAAATGTLAILGLIDLEGTSFKVGAIQCLHRAGCISIRHFHEAEAARAARISIRD